MKNAVWKVCCIGLFAFLAGCNLDLTPEPERTNRAIAKTANELADDLRGIRDADSARAASEKIDRKFTSLGDLIGRIPAIQREQQDPRDAADPASTEACNAMRTAVSRLNSESERLDDLPGLPLEFWKMFESREIELALKICEAAAASQPEALGEAYQFTQNFEELAGESRI